MILLLPFAFMLAGDLNPGQVRLLADCSDSSETVATVAAATPLKVVSSYAGGTPCYSVAASTPQGEVRGFTTSADHPAIQAFERDRQASFAARLIAPPAPVEAAAVAVDAPPPMPAAPKSAPPSMAGIALKDINGRSIALNPGGLTLLFFWVPDDPRSEGQLRRIAALRKRYSGQGLQVIGIGEGASIQQMREYFDERALAFPQVADDSSTLERRLRIPARPGAAILGPDSRVLGVSASVQAIETDLARLLGENSRGEQP